MTSIFLDTSYVIALEAVDDQNHEAAIRHWRNFRTSLPTLVTTSYIVAEVVTFFNSRNRHAKAVEVGNLLMSTSSVQLIHVDPALFYEAWLYFKRHTDKIYSLADCISFVVMDRLRIRTALTFDTHFVQAGFEKLP